MARFIECEQGTEAWFDARAGHATASRFADIMAGRATREAYMWQLVAERLAGPMRDSGGQAKQWGHDSEVIARRVYQERTGELVRQVGFAIHDKIKWVGASSDGLVGARGAIEVKSPFNSGIHASTLALGMPGMHHAQCQGNLWILDRDWIDFSSFDPAYSAPYDLFIERQHRDEIFIKQLEKEVKLFLAEVNIQLAGIKQKYH